MQGLCHTCFGSNLETKLDKFSKPICKNCSFKNSEETKT